MSYAIELHDSENAIAETRHFDSACEAFDYAVEIDSDVIHMVIHDMQSHEVIDLADLYGDAAQEAIEV